MADSLALAVLENLVHLNSSRLPCRLRGDWGCNPKQREDPLARTIPGDRGDLNSQTIGDRWIESGRSAVLRVPSVVIRSEFIYLLNPRHQDFANIVTEIAVPFTFDERLFQTFR